GLERGFVALSLDDEEEEEYRHRTGLIWFLRKRNSIWMDLERVQKRSPWTSNNHLLMLHHLRKKEYLLKVPLIFANFWVQIHEVPPGERVRKSSMCEGSVGCKVIFEEEEEGHSDSYCQANTELRFEIAKMRWDLSLRDQSRHALAMNSVWLKEDGGDVKRRSFYEGSNLRRRNWEKVNRRGFGSFVDPILGVNLEGI
ncbi:hypothetical protein Golax_020012, partial [Gossypium laxum]|nr:hypothetical protein [Gossypium laxum]